MTSNRKFGIEIEVHTYKTSQEIAGILVAAGINCKSEALGHSVPSQWKVVSDGSIVGWEVVSPPLCGDGGIAEARKVCGALSAAGITVNKACGFHVHVDANDINQVDILNVVTRYAKFEGEIDGFMPRSRRGSDNTFCKSVVHTLRLFQDNDFKDVSGAPITRVLRNSHGYDERRYSKVNLCSYIRQGTIEFRQHSGTVNADKVENWIRFCVSFVEASKVRFQTVTREVQSTRMTSGLGRTRRSNSVLTKYEKLADLLEVSVSPERIAEVLGIAVSSVPSFISTFRTKYGVRVECSRYSGHYTSYAHNLGTMVRSCNAISEGSQMVPQIVTTTETVNVAVTDIPGDTLFRDIPASVRGFYTERAMELA